MEAHEAYRMWPVKAWAPNTEVVRTAADAGASLDMAGLWRRFGSGRYTISSSFCTEKRCYVSLSESESPERNGRFLTPRNMEVLRRILLGDPQKVIAVELGLSPSTVSLIASRCLAALGIRCCIAKVPLIMVAAAHADGRGAASFDAREAEVRVDGGRFIVVGFRRPDGALRQRLSSSRCAVARMRVEGLTHGEIAKLRGTSPRTVANQLSATFRQLQVSGRIELLRRLIRDELEVSSDPAEHKPALVPSRGVTDPLVCAVTDQPPIIPMLSGAASSAASL